MVIYRQQTMGDRLKLVVAAAEMGNKIEIIAEQNKRSPWFVNAFLRNANYIRRCKCQRSMPPFLPPFTIRL
jgi:hypothetical protein